MTTLDWIVLGLFFLGLVGIIVWVLWQKEDDTSDLVKIKGLTLGSASKEEVLEVRQSYNHWDVINSAIIIAITLAFYAYFW